jgi:hypothetical protein
MAKVQNSGKWGCWWRRLNLGQRLIDPSAAKTGFAQTLVCLHLTAKGLETPRHPESVGLAPQYAATNAANARIFPNKADQTIAC